MNIKSMLNLKFKISNLKKNRRNQSGFTLLLSLIVAGIILSVGLGTYEIISREIRISSVGRESQIAFYAANAAADCAFYLEIKNPSSRQCAGASVAEPDGNGSYGFTANLTGGVSGEDESPCAKVDVSRTISSGITTITIESRGYNVCGDSSIKVERAVRLTLKKK